MSFWTDAADVGTGFGPGLLEGVSLRDAAARREALRDARTQATNDANTKAALAAIEQQRAQFELDQLQTLAGRRDSVYPQITPNDPALGHALSFSSPEQAGRLLADRGAGLSPGERAGMAREFMPPSMIAEVDEQARTAGFGLFAPQRMGPRMNVGMGSVAVPGARAQPATAPPARPTPAGSLDAQGATTFATGLAGALRHHWSGMRSPGGGRAPAAATTGSLDAQGATTFATGLAGALRHHWSGMRSPGGGRAPAAATTGMTPRLGAPAAAVSPTADPRSAELGLRGELGAGSSALMRRSMPGSWGERRTPATVPPGMALAPPTASLSDIAAENRGRLEGKGVLDSALAMFDGDTARARAMIGDLHSAGATTEEALDLIGAVLADRSRATGSGERRDLFPGSVQAPRMMPPASDSPNPPAATAQPPGALGPAFDQLVARVADAEGFRDRAYSDAGGTSAIGYGFNLDTGGFPADSVAAWRERGISRETADNTLRSTLQDRMGQLRSQWPAFDRQPPELQMALTDAAYQLGVSGLLDFRQMLGMIEAGNAEGAIASIQQSRWAQQTPARSNRLIQVIQQTIGQPPRGP